MKKSETDTYIIIYNLACFTGTCTCLVTNCNYLYEKATVFSRNAFLGHVNHTYWEGRNCLCLHVCAWYQIAYTPMPAGIQVSFKNFLKLAINQNTDFPF